MAVCPDVATFVMLATIALGLPVAFSCATAPFKLLTSEQYAGLPAAGAAALLPADVVLLAAAVVLLAAAVVELLLPHPATNAVVRTSTSVAARGRAGFSRDERSVMSPT
jgi:hypothetical protein